MEVAELIKQAKLGNKSALNTLLQQNYKKLYGFVIKMTTDEDLAEDITQETLLKAVININSYKCKSSFSTWLIQISINTYKDYLRKNRRLDPAESLEDFPSVENFKNNAMMRLEYEEAIKELKSMTYKKRTAFILKHYYGYSLEEISIIMDCPIGTVKSRINKCIERLRQIIC